MSLEHIRKVYEKWGRENPFHAVLSTRRFRNAEEAPEDFFETGRREIRRVLDYVERELDRELRRERALDFGCGVGRLSQALAEHFREVHGVDIAEAMVEKARELNAHGDRVRYYVNTTDDLGRFPEDHFDLAYSSITLQHIPPRHIERYVAEFVRVVRPGGLAIFQLPDGPRIEPGTLRALLYRFKREHFRRFWKRIRGLPAYEMHYLARARVEEVVRESGGRVVDVRKMGEEDTGTGLRYAVTPEPRRG